MDIVIKNAQVVTENGIFNWDIGIKNGIIKELVNSGCKEIIGEREINAIGKTIFPGLIDEHTHFDEPGTENEGFETGSYSLAASGVTTVFDHPINSNPPVRDVDSYLKKEKAANEHSLIDFGIVGGVAPNNLGEIKKMYDLGAIAFKGFVSQNTGTKKLEYLDDIHLIKAMSEVKKTGKVMLLHAENEAICSFLKEENLRCKRETFEDYEKERPIISEVESVRRIIAFSRITGCHVHIVHASSKKVVDIITQAKKEGVPITVETCPHYLALNVNDFSALNGAKCCPPLRKIEEINPLWETLRNGEIDTIGSDHSSMPLGNGKFGGLSGGQSTLSVLLEEGYHKRNIPLELIARITSANSAKIFGIYPKKGTIAVGSDADLAIVDLNEKFTLKKKDLFDRQKHSQYIGKTFRGKVKCTILRGTIIFEDDTIVGTLGEARRVNK